MSRSDCAPPPPPGAVRRPPALLLLAAPLLACAAARPLSVPAAAAPAPSRSLLATAFQVQGQVVGVRGIERMLVPVGGGQADLRVLEASGSGVRLAGGLVATSLHLVVLPDPGGRLRVADEIAIDQGGGAPARAEVARMFPALDLALLRLEPAGVRPGAELATEAAAPAEPLLALSGAGGRLATAQVACASIESDGDGPGLIRIDDRDLGNRFLGGPLFGADGKLQGLLVATPGEAPGALPASVVRRALEADLHASADAL